MKKSDRFSWKNRTVRFWICTKPRTPLFESALYGYPCINESYLIFFSNEIIDERKKNHSFYTGLQEKKKPGYFVRFRSLIEDLSKGCNYFFFLISQPWHMAENLLSKVWAKKVYNPKTCILVENPQFLSYLWKTW